MKPVLASMPQRKRNILFLPTAAGIFLVAFIVLALATQNFFVTALLSPVAAVAGAWALLGWPVITRKDGRPLVDEQTRPLLPYLFFVLAPLFAIVFYPVLGVALTQAGLPPKVLAWVSLGVAIPAACALAYRLVGFPSFVGQARAAYAKLPPERRPFLFFPLFAVFFLVVYLLVGVGTTQVVARFPGQTALFLRLQVLLVLPLSLLVAALAAYLLVGVPKPQRSPREYLPKVTGRHRPNVFLATWLLGGVPATVIIGAVLTSVAKTGAAGKAFLPATIVLPMAVVLGFLVSLGVAALWWGTPARWRRYDDYKPGISPRARKPLFLGISAAVALAVIVAFGLAGLDIFWGLLVGGFAGVVVAMHLLGAIARIRARKGQGTLLPDLPDKMKPLVLFPVWFAVAFLVFTVLTYAFPALVTLNFVLGVVLGLAIAVFLVEQGYFRELRARRRREAERRKARKARRDAALQGENAENGSPDG